MIHLIYRNFLRWFLSKGGQGKSPEEILKQLMNSSAENSSGTSSHNEKQSETQGSTPDMETMMKLMHILQSSQQNNPSKELLHSLKPFLNETRQEKVDQYIQLLGITKAIETFQEMENPSK